MGALIFNNYGALTTDLASPSDRTRDHGLRFINEDWNGSISNGHPYTLRWNESIGGDGGGLKLFRVRYPEEGQVAFELVSNLTESMEELSCYWTPENLIEDNLYALWVTRVGEEEDPVWALSPPWRVSEQEQHGFHWTNPVGIPIVVIIAVYFLSLGTCLWYRRRKRNKRERDRHRKQTVEDVAPPLPDTDRHPSVSSVVTVQTLTEDDELVKKDEDVTWLVTNPATPRSPTRVVEWNNMVWNSETPQGYGAEPMMRHENPAWGHGWYDVPIGQAR